MLEKLKTFFMLENPKIVSYLFYPSFTNTYTISIPRGLSSTVKTFVQRLRARCHNPLEKGSLSWGYAIQETYFVLTECLCGAY